MNYEENLTYEWLQGLREKLIKEEKVRNFVSGNTAKTAAAVGALDIEFQKGSGDDIQLDQNWVSQNIVPVTLHDNQKVQFNKNYAQLLINAFKNACEASQKAGKAFCPKNNGAFNDRTMRGRDNISNHAFGTAIDFLTAGTQAQITNYPEFINAMKQGGFIWGGDWSAPYYDPMHFEVNIGGAVPTGVGGGENVGQGLASDWRQSFSNFLSNIGIKDQPVFSNLSENVSLEKEPSFTISDKTTDKRFQKNKKLLMSMLSYYNKRLNLTKPVRIVFVEDENNAKNPLGRTAFYNPDKMSITIYTTNRFIKDIMRSLGHELIHHKQHCIDEFENMATPEGYAQKNKKLRKKEEEAYLFGNMLFRDWEDKYKAKHKKEL